MFLLERKNSAKSIILMGGFPPGYGLCFISVNFDNFLVDDNHSLLAM